MKKKSQKQTQNNKLYQKHIEQKLSESIQIGSLEKISKNSLEKKFYDPYEKNDNLSQKKSKGFTTSSKNNKKAPQKLSIPESFKVLQKYYEFISLLKRTDNFGACLKLKNKSQEQHEMFFNSKIQRQNDKFINKLIYYKPTYTKNQSKSQNQKNIINTNISKDFNSKANDFENEKPYIFALIGSVKNLQTVSTIQRVKDYERKQWFESQVQQYTQYTQQERNVDYICLQLITPIKYPSHFNNIINQKNKRKCDILKQKKQNIFYQNDERMFDRSITSQNIIAKIVFDKKYYQKNVTIFNYIMRDSKENQKGSNLSNCKNNDEQDVIPIFQRFFCFSGLKLGLLNDQLMFFSKSTQPQRLKKIPREQNLSAALSRSQYQQVELKMTNNISGFDLFEGLRQTQVFEVQKYLYNLFFSKLQKTLSFYYGYLELIDYSTIKKNSEQKQQKQQRQEQKQQEQEQKQNKKQKQQKLMKLKKKNQYEKLNLNKFQQIKQDIKGEQEQEQTQSQHYQLETTYQGEQSSDCIYQKPNQNKYEINSKSKNKQKQIQNYAQKVQEKQQILHKNKNRQQQPEQEQKQCQKQNNNSIQKYSQIQSGASLRQLLNYIDKGQQKNLYSKIEIENKNTFCFTGVVKSIKLLQICNKNTKMNNNFNQELDSYNYQQQKQNQKKNQQKELYEEYQQQKQKLERQEKVSDSNNFDNIHNANSSLELTPFNKFAYNHNHFNSKNKCNSKSLNKDVSKSDYQNFKQNFNQHEEDQEFDDKQQNQETSFHKIIQQDVEYSNKNNSTHQEKDLLRSQVRRKKAMVSLEQFDKSLNFNQNTQNDKKSFQKSLTKYKESDKSNQKQRLLQKVQQFSTIELEYVDGKKIQKKINPLKQIQKSKSKSLPKQRNSNNQILSTLYLSSSYNLNIKQSKNKQSKTQKLLEQAYRSNKEKERMKQIQQKKKQEQANNNSKNNIDSKYSLKEPKKNKNKISYKKTFYKDNQHKSNRNNRMKNILIEVVEDTTRVTTDNMIGIVNIQGRYWAEDEELILNQLEVGRVTLFKDMHLKIIPKKIEMCFKFQFKKKNPDKNIIMLNKFCLPVIHVNQYQNLKITKLKQLAKPVMFRNIMKAEVAYAQCEFMFGKIICENCNKILRIKQYCDQCEHVQGILSLWTNILVSDQTLNARLSLQTTQIIQFFNFSIEEIEQIKSTIYQNNEFNTGRPVKIYSDYMVRFEFTQKSIKNFQKKLEYSCILKQIVGIPKFDEYMTFCSFLYQQKIDFLAGFQQKSEFLKDKKIYFNGFKKTINKQAQQRVLAYIKVLHVMDNFF